MLGFLLRSSLALSLVKLHLEGLNVVSRRLEHMQRRLSVVKMLEPRHANVCILLRSSNYNLGMFHPYMEIKK